MSKPPDTRSIDQKPSAADPERPRNTTHEIAPKPVPIGRYRAPFTRVGAGTDEPLARPEASAAKEEPGAAPQVSQEDVTVRR